MLRMKDGAGVRAASGSDADVMAGVCSSESPLTIPSRSLRQTDTGGRSMDDRRGNSREVSRLAGRLSLKSSSRKSISIWDAEIGLISQ